MGTVNIPCPCGHIHKFPWEIAQEELDKGLIYVEATNCECGNQIKLIIKNLTKIIEVAEREEKEQSWT